MICSRKEDNVSEALSKLKGEGLTVSGIVCHVAKSEDRKKLYDEAVSKFGGIDILISNAAINPVMGPVLDVINAKLHKLIHKYTDLVVYYSAMRKLGIKFSKLM